MTNVTTIDPSRLPYKLNSLLPHDIRVTWMSQTAPDFNVTVTAKHKVCCWELESWDMSLHITAALPAR